MDCDDTLYVNNGRSMDKITENMEHFCTTKLNLEGGICYDLYKKYGSTLQGLLQEGKMEKEMVDDWLDTTHTSPNKPWEFIEHDERLRSFLLKVRVQKFIFTAGIRSHVQRCCQALGVEDVIFSDSRPIIDARTCNFGSKYSAESFEICVKEISTFLKMDVDPKDLVFVDDTLKNVQCAKENGWGVCILMGAQTPSGKTRKTELDGVDHVIEHLSELASIDGLQDLFEDGKIVQG